MAKVKTPASAIFGVLPDWAIKDYIKRRIIKISPLGRGWEKQVRPVSMDFHLGRKILVPEISPHKTIDVKKGVSEADYEVIKLKKGQPYTLMPEEFIITVTREKLTLPRDILGRLEGKSSLARLGLVVHLTSGRFDPGWQGVPVLELKNNGQSPITIYEGWPICAFSFERLAAKVSQPYSRVGRYNSQRIASLAHLDGRR